ncbi:MAG: hypothetical protein A2Y17_01620 [Clostridiales bacterium GWF2_38_85]|nr:MAG: hypothetical protein A2Y17_01620 [Clostridiales bacterium GWF2_38_85]HBL84793.1 hypothetical protein [Clostridiales bacterium]
MTIKKVLVFMLLAALVLPVMVISGMAVESGAELVCFIDGENVTRWADTSVVYRKKANTEQNEWGYNVVVGADGKVMKLIDSGDTSGKNLFIPEDGMVVSATGTKIEWLKTNIVAGDYVYYDSISSRVLVSKDGEFSPFYEVGHTITGFNQVRYASTFIIYNKSGNQTGTNGYGYEVSVNSEGTIISAGGNDNTVPDSGYVISAIEPADKEFLKMYGIVGASAVIGSDKKTVIISYNSENLRKSVQLRIEGLNTKISGAKASYMQIDYDELESKITSFEIISDYASITLQKRNKLFEEIDAVGYEISESPAVELRGIWHETVETTVAGVQKVVSDLKAAGINQLNLGISSGYNTILPLVDDFPFKQKASLRGVDILQAYVDECEKAGIELIVSVAIFRNSAGASTIKPEWLTKSNGVESAEDESQYFFNPANNEYREYIKRYLLFIIENYEIDGLQLDYIRYPGTVGGIDYGYDDLTKSMFAEKYNVDASIVDEIATRQSSHSMWSQWIEFKVELVTSFVEEIRLLTTTIRPDIYLSAAVASDTRLSTYCQDTEKWMQDGLLDAIYPMTYGEGVLSSRLDTFAGFTGESAYLFMGSGSYMTLSDAETYKQTIDSRYNADGVCFFEYFSYLAHGYSKFLLQNAFKTPALTPTLSSTEAVKAQIEYAAKRINDVIVPYEGITQDKATQIIDSLDALSGDITIEKTDAAIEAINAIIEGTDSEIAIQADLAKLRKIILLSKDAAKAAYPGIDKDESTVESEAESEAATSGVESQADKTKSNFPLPLIIAIGAVIVAAGVVFVIKKKKK